MIALPSTLPQALLLSHGRKDVRDTSKYPPLMKALVRCQAGGRAFARLAGAWVGRRLVLGCLIPGSW